MVTDIYFLNPTENMFCKIENYLRKSEYEEETINDSTCRFRKGETFIDVCEGGVSVGKYITVVCSGVNNEMLRKLLCICPECGSKYVKPSILWVWRNTLTEQLYDEGKLEYGPGAYDRFGTKPPTKKCMGCGCMWHNDADIVYWNQVIKSGKTLTKDDLGINC